MFVGHLSIGLIGKRAEPGISLGTWLLAVMLADLICFPLLIAGVEYFHGALGHIPYSHSLLTNVIWGALFAAGYCLLRRYPRGAWLLFAGVLSHWVLDVISHRPDMQLSPGISNVWGLGLWNSVPATLIVEGGFWLLAIIVYVRAAHPKTRASHFAFWVGIALLTLLWYGNIRRGMDPDPVRAGVGGLILFSLVVAWGYWMNARRRLPDPEPNRHRLR
jgi:hypothetical protein